jgi:MASE1
VTLTKNARLTVALRVLALLAAFVLAGLAAWRAPLLAARENVPLLWLPAGLGLAASLVLGWRFFPIVLVGAFMCGLVAELPANFFLLGLAVGSTAGGLLGAWLLKKFLRFENHLEAVRFAAGLLVIGCAVCAPVNAAALAAGAVLEKKNRVGQFSTGHARVVDSLRAGHAGDRARRPDARDALAHLALAVAGG